MGFTYEDIYELLRTEKYTTDLQPLKKEDLIKVKEYFDTKQVLLDKQVEGSTFYNPEKKEKLKLEIENAKRAIKDLYEKREQKIINRALFSSRTDFKLKDSTNMLSCEIKLYDNLIELLRTGNKEFFEDVDSSKPKISAPILPAKALKAEQEPSTKKVLFINNVPEIMDSNLNKYGPFEASAIATLPNEIADLLIKQNKAVEHGEDSQKN